MKSIYSIVITPPENGEEYYTVYVPDLDIYTEGKDISDAIYMAKDAIGAAGITREDLGLPLPKGTTLKPKCKENEVVALVDVDFSAYREKEDTRMVRKNCTIRGTAFFVKTRLRSCNGFPIRLLFERRGFGKYLRAVFDWR